MKLNKVPLGFFIVTLSCVLQTNAKSLGNKAHQVEKRHSYLWEDSCPPMAFTGNELNKTCTDTCVTDDYCTGRQLCCLSNGCKTCMEPVLPPPVIDWLGGLHRGYAESREGKNEIILTEPHYEEVVCIMDNKTYPKGVFYKGCRKCSCNIGGYITCELRCKGKRPTNEENSGSGDDDEDSPVNPPIREEHLNQIFPIIHGEDNEVTAEIVRPKPVYLALDQPKVDTTKQDGESGDDDKEEHGSGDNVIEMSQKHETNIHQISTHKNEVDEVPKLGDIFLV